MLKAVAYDMDDLMVNSIGLHRKAWQAVLAKYNHTFDEIPEKMRAGFVGKRMVEIAASVIDTLDLDVDPEELRRERINIFLELINKELKVLPGLKESLDFFKNNNFKIALSTSAVDKYVDIVLDKFNLRDYFSVIVSGNDVKTGKPDPETYLVSAQKLAVAPNECLVLEDATHGIESAKAAGCKCIAVKNNNTLPQDLSKADLILDSLLDINLDIIKSLE